MSSPEVEPGFNLPQAPQAWCSITLHGDCIVHSFIQQTHSSPATVPSILYDDEEPYRVKQPILEGTLPLPFSRSVMSDSLVTPRTVAHQAPLRLGFPKQESWSGLPLPFGGGLTDPGMELVSSSPEGK